MTSLYGSNYNTALLPSAIEILEKHFNIICICNLYAYTNKMAELYARLKQLRKDTYLPTDRLIFVFDDIDDHMTEDAPGCTLYNLQLILADLDIPNYFCLILSNRPDYNLCTEAVQRLLTTDSCPISSITTLLNSNWLIPVIPRIFNEQQITHAFCVLSRLSRQHRSYFMSQLFRRNLQEYGLVSYYNISHIFSTITIEDNLINDCNHLSFVPFRKCLPSLLIYNKENQEIFSQFLSLYPKYNNFTEIIDTSDKGLMMEFLPDSPLLNALIYVGLETVVAPSKIFISRISLRGIIEQRPFILFAQPGTLRFIKSLGFKTFNDFWDESYDDIINLEDRVDAILTILQDWSTLSVDELHAKCNDMKDIIEYNYDFYTNHFEQRMLDSLDKQCQENL